MIDKIEVEGLLLHDTEKLALQHGTIECIERGKINFMGLQYNTKRD